MTLHVPADTLIALFFHGARCFLLPMWRCCCALYVTVTALRRGLQQIKAGRAAQLHGQMSIQVAVWKILEEWNISIVDFPRCDTYICGQIPSRPSTSAGDYGRLEKCELYSNELDLF